MSIFYNEISDIMRGFGDCEVPLRESVLLVEKILHQQLCGILSLAIQLAVHRKKASGEQQISITQADFIYLMRKSPEKILRLQKHMKELVFRKRIQEMLSGRPVSLDEEEVAAGENCVRDLLDKHDEEKTRRLFRADRIALALSGAQYQQYNLARRTSFYCRNALSARFRAWLNVPPDVYISPHVMAILTYLAHETIATIVDFAILTRLNSANRTVDPHSRIAHSAISHQMLHLCPDVTQGRGSDGIKPITVQEINEGIRRHTFMTTGRNKGGKFRHAVKPEVRYLAL